jgi:hypothetical protein
MNGQRIKSNYIILNPKQGRGKLIFTRDVPSIFETLLLINIITLARVVQSETNDIIAAPQMRISFVTHLLCVS